MLEFASSLEHIRSLECLKLHLNHDEVLLDLSVVREATHWVDGLVSNVIPFKRKMSAMLHQFKTIACEWSRY